MTDHWKDAFEGSGSLMSPIPDGLLATVPISTLFAPECSKLCLACGALRKRKILFWLQEAIQNLGHGKAALRLKSLQVNDAFRTDSVVCFLDYCGLLFLAEAHNEPCCLPAHE